MRACVREIQVKNQTTLKEYINKMLKNFQKFVIDIEIQFLVDNDILLNSVRMRTKVVIGSLTIRKQGTNPLKVSFIFRALFFSFLFTSDDF